MTDIADATSFQRNVGVSDSTAAIKQWSDVFQTAEQPFALNNPDRKQRNTHYGLPDAGFGMSEEFLGTVINMQILTGEVWYTQVVLPIIKDMNLKGIRWNKYNFDHHAPDLIPIEGVARLLDVQRETQSRGFLRQGLAFHMEHGFMETDEGRMVYQGHLAQIANAVQEANNFDVIHALVTAKRYEQEWIAKYGTIESKDIYARLRDEKQTWAILQKGKNAFETLDSILTRKTRRWQVNMTAYIFPEDASSYLRLVPHEKTDFYMAGAAGPSRVAAYDSVEPYFMHGHYSIYLARTFATDKQKDADLLVRERQIGEYHLLIDRYKDEDVIEHTSRDQEVMIYDEDYDRFTRITMKHAFQYGNLFENVYDNDAGVWRQKLRMPAPAHPVPNYEADLKHDFLLRPSGRGRNGLEPIDLFGEMAQSALSTQSALNIGKTLGRLVAEEYGGGLPEVNSVLREGRAVLRAISQRVPNLTWIRAVVDANQGVQQSPADERYVKENGKLVWKTNGDGGFDLPNIRNDGEAQAAALVGFANWPGMLAMAREASNVAPGASVTNKGYNGKDMATVARLVNLLESTAYKLEPILQNSLVLDEKFTPLQYTQTSAAAVLAENLLGIGGHALWLRGNMKDDKAATIAAAFARDQAPFIAKAARFDNEALRNLVNLEYSDDLTFERIETTRAFAEALNRLDETKATAFAAAFAQPANQTVAQLVAYINANPTHFQGSKKELQAFTKDLQASLTAARQDDADPSKTVAKAYADEPLVGVEYRAAPPVAADLDGNAFYRTPLTLAAPQVRQLARASNPRDLKVTVSAPGTFNTRAASALELQRLAQVIERIGQDGKSAEARAVSNAMLQKVDLDTLERLDVVQLSRATAAKRAHAQVAAAEPVRRQRRRFAPGPVQEMGGDAMEVVGDDYYHPVDGGDGGAGGYQRGARGDGRYVGTKYASFEGALATNYRAVAKASSDELSKLLAKVYLLTPITQSVLEKMHDNNVIIPLNAIVARAHMRYQMKMAIKLVPGSSTGNTYMGYTKFEIGDDPKIQMHVGEYRYWSKAIVREHKNVHVVYDIFCAGRSGGAGSKPIDISLYDPRNANYGGGDLLFFIVPYEETEFVDPLDASGRLSYYDMAATQDREAFAKLHYSTAARYNGALGFRTTSDMGYAVEDYQHPWKEVYEKGEQRPNNVPFNTVMWRGEERFYNRVSRQFDLNVGGTGHWGGFARPGARAARDGDFVPMERNDTTHVQLR